MVKVRESLYRKVRDVLIMPTVLNELASEFIIEGYEVKRGILGSVILPLNDGEVHYIPGGDGVYEYLFQH